jgi:hypothetical protein
MSQTNLLDVSSKEVVRKLPVGSDYCPCAPEVCGKRRRETCKRNYTHCREAALHVSLTHDILEREIEEPVLDLFEDQFPLSESELKRINLQYSV